MTLRRTDQINALERGQDQPWDVIVIGGGATGLGTAVDAAQRGLRVLLVEAADFARGTSSKSTKLVHGGVRYLAQGHLSLVYEALHERGLLYRNAPHLVRDLELIIPCYSHLEKWKYWTGLKVYDQLAGALRFQKTQSLSAGEVQKRLPNVRGAGLKGGISFHDGQFDDTRLAINLAQTAIQLGATLVNYARVTKIDPRLRTVSIRDQLAANEWQVQSRLIVNATGVDVDSILSMIHDQHEAQVVPSQGSHLVLDQSFLGSQTALMIPKTSDGRVLFAIPWYHRTIVGTTDLQVEKSGDEPVPLEQEIDFILQQSASYLDKKPTGDDVKSIFAGQRPLAAPRGKQQKSKEISRSHKLSTDQDFMITVVGGKWTTYRIMAEEIVDRCCQLLGIKRPCLTRDLQLHGATMDHPTKFDPRQIYGKDQLDLPVEPPLLEGQSLTAAQVRHACREEMAARIDDVLLRRSRIGFLDARAALQLIPLISPVMAQELGWNVEEKRRQEDSAQETLKRYLPR